MGKLFSYDYKDFEDKYGETFLASGVEIVSLILNFIKPGSVVDVGCGNGTLLSVFSKHGINDILGIEGPWVDRNSLVIDNDKFMVHDLKKPLRLDRSFDLAISFEVAEHLPGECADKFVHSLVKLAPVILFSAAIPFQGGNKHVNEQWPDYWRQLFGKYNYEMIDCLRNRLWDNPRAKWWLAQNGFFYVDKDHIGNYPRLEREYREKSVMPLRCVHPKNYLQKTDVSISGLLRSLFRLLKRKVFH